LLGASYVLAATNPVQIGTIFIFSVLNCIFYYRSTSSKLRNTENVQLLDARNGYWDLSKSFVSEDEKNKGESLAKVLIPLGGSIGAILSKSTVDQNMINSALIFFLSIICFSFPGLQLAIAKFLIQYEKKFNKRIVV
jgi:hypothetical protein